MTVVDLERSGKDPQCFLCQPADELVYEESESLLGLGPIGEGYSLIATREHIPSMLDLDRAAHQELVEFTDTVRGRLGLLFGSCVVTEHGRVPPCIDRLVRAYEPHCLHAHRLVFPGAAPIDLHSALGGSIDHFSTAQRAFESNDISGQYLFVENPDGAVQLAQAVRPLPRQFFRRVVAWQLGAPELSDWQKYPRYDEVARARLRLRAAA